MSLIEQQLRATNLFNALTAVEFERLCTEVETLEFAPGEVVVRQGEPGDALYIIISGAVQVFAFAQDGQEVVLARLEEREFFGEQALLVGQSERRNAYVRAFSQARLLKIGKDAFQRVLSLDSPLKQKLTQVGDQQLRQNLLRQSSLFRSLQLDQKALTRTESFASGDIVFREGEVGDRLYVITAGTAGVFKQEEAGPRLVVRLGEGQCFGELALIKKQPRAATVIAEGPLEVLSIDGERFLELYNKTPELREYMQTLQNVYVLPGRGFTTQHAGMFLGFDSIMTMYHLWSGRRFVAARVIGREIYNMSVVLDGEVEARRIHYRDGETGDERELAVHNGQLVGLTVWGSWSELGAAHRMLLDETPLERWQEEVFREKGMLRLEEDAKFFEDTEVICACMQVTRGTLRKSIQSGCDTCEKLCERTGAGSVCGACMPRLKELIGRPDWTPVVCTAVIRVNDDVRSFRLKPNVGELKPALPGQHIVVQTRIDDNWVQRPYTLSSPSGETSYYEITVKREPRGLFSRWLFDQLNDNAFIRVSSPQGNFVLEPDLAVPAICLVGGIGMTPALAMVRSIIAEGRKQRLHVDYSCSRRNHFAYIEELQQAASDYEGISLTWRVTQEQGYIRREELEALLADMPQGVFYICGPQGFQSHLQQLLASLGVVQQRIRTEEFTPQGAKPDVKKVEVTEVVVGRPALSVPSSVPPGPKPADKPPVPEIRADQPVSVKEEARAFLKQFFYEKGVPQAFEARWNEVEKEIEQRGIYVQTYDELSFGAKLSWRNSARCIGRLFWQGLQVRDMRYLQTEDEIFEALCEHIQLATNGGNLRAVMTVFNPQQPGEPGPRIWNPQLLRYAGYQLEDGSWIGDPANSALTQAALKLGWTPDQRTHFDILPLIIQLPHREPKLFEIPKELVLEVSISHPDYKWFGDFELRWYALPAVSEMLFDCGGIRYTCAPFNGWYMGTEIGARNFSDDYRYNMLPIIAEKMGLDTRRDRSLWKDRALVELNIAVLHSFEQHGVKMVDHHAASNDFMEFVEQEAAAGRRIDARWSWIVPPLSGSLSKPFHVEWEEVVIKPNYFYQPRPFDHSVE